MNYIDGLRHGRVVTTNLKRVGRRKTMQGKITYIW